MAPKNISRRHAIPILYTRGTHYDVGFDMGRNFASMIKNFVQICGPLNDVYLPLYDTDEGKQAYNETLESVKKSFPQYIRELEGVSDGAQVEFHKLFLLHMDDITPQCLKHDYIASNEAAIGCSTILLNGPNDRILAHTEDALSEQLNHFYYVVAHIINDTPQGKYNVTEEHFMSLCYAGHLPGYTMNYNHHGLVFTINTLSAKSLLSGKTPRHFITRALLSVQNYDEALRVLKDKGVGAADGCSINIAFINDDPNMCYNIEMAPTERNGNESKLSIKQVPAGDYNYHVNQYQRLQIEEANGVMLDSSNSRMKSFHTYKPPQTKADVVKMLSDVKGGKHCVFRENGTLDEDVKTIALGVFDLNAKTYTIYSDNPASNKPHCTLPLILKDDDSQEECACANSAK